MSWYPRRGVRGCSAALGLGRSLRKGKDVLAAQMCWSRDQIDDSLQPGLRGIETEELSHPLCPTWLFPGTAEEFGAVLAQRGTASSPWQRAVLVRAGLSRAGAGLVSPVVSCEFAAQGPSRGHSKRAVSASPTPPASPSPANSFWY